MRRGRLTCKYDKDSNNKFFFSVFPTGEGRFKDKHGRTCYVDGTNIRCSYEATTDVSRYEQGTANEDETNIAESAKFDITFDPDTRALTLKSKKLTNKAYCQTGSHVDKYVGCKKYKSGVETFTATSI